MIFETECLFVRRLNETDGDLFFELMSNPAVMSLIPEPVLTRDQSDFQLKKLIGSESSADLKIWAVCLRANREFIGIAGFLKSAEHEDEIAYRILERFWKQGFGTEITRGLLDFGFKEKKMELITADVFIENKGSVKILEKFFTLEKEFFNAKDNCTDRKYKLKKEDWIKLNNQNL